MSVAAPPQIQGPGTASAGLRADVPAPTGEAGLSSDRIAQLAKALGQPARVTIVQLLADAEPRSAGELTATLGLAQSTVWEHLRILQAAGVVSRGGGASRSLYRLQRGVLRSLARALDGLDEVSIQL